VMRRVLVTCPSTDPLTTQAIPRHSVPPMEV
jgi:hypothetical protein